MSNEDVIQVGEMDPNLQNSEIVDHPPEDPASEGEDSRTMCYFNGTAYSPGSQICSGGNLLYCYSGGTWGRTGSC